MVNNKQLNYIHEKTLDILENTGVIFNHKETLDMFKRHGIKVNGNKAYFKPKLVETCLKSVPSSFKLNGRNPNNSVIVGDGNPTVCVAPSGSLYIQEKDGPRRAAGAKDFVNFVKLVNDSPYLMVNGGALVIPKDVESEAINAFMMAASLFYSDKPLRGFSSGMENAKESIEMAKIVFGEKISKGILIGMASVNSPLHYDKENIEGIREYVINDQPIGITACSLAGSSTPVTLAGTLAVNNAEVLAGIVMTQLLKPGAPVIYGNTSSIVDMKSMLLALGSAESSLIINGAKQLAAYYGIPCRSGGALTDAKYPDVQAGYESMMHIFTTLTSNVDYATQTAGVLDSFMTLSYEKFIIDEEIGMMVKRLIKGFDVSEETIPMDLINERGPGGFYLDSEHTFKNFKSEFATPVVSNRGNYKNWKMGENDALTKAQNVWRDRLESYVKPEMDKACQNCLKQYLDEKYGDYIMKMLGEL